MNLIKKIISNQPVQNNLKNKIINNKNNQTKIYNKKSMN